MNGATQIASSHHYTLEELAAIMNGNGIALSAATLDRVRACRKYLEEKMSAPNALFYGINTGFGGQYNIRISPDEIDELQRNLIHSHTAGVGDRIPEEIARLILLIKIISLSKGYSAIRPMVINRLIELFNRHVTPVIYQFGSLGASGDLAPLAHLSMAIIGEGEFYAADTRPAKPVKLEAKEGLALINGTQFSTAYGIYASWSLKRILNWANTAAATSLCAFDCSFDPFDERIHAIRPHNGPRAVSADILALIHGFTNHSAEHLQDPYSFRCIPQVHGATHDALHYVQDLLETELNSVTDNPLVFFETDAILSGGNFHAQPVALALDYLAMAVAEIGSIAERRTYKLLRGERDLPPSLTRNPGLQSGLMISQYTAAALVNRNKVLCSPASVDSIPSSMGQEDHVSMAANAGLKLQEICRNVEQIVAIEFMCAMQAADLREDLVLPQSLQAIRDGYREVVPLISADTALHDHFAETVNFFKCYQPDA